MLTDMLQQAGFKGTFVKPDPRGPEYGHFEAERLDDNRIRVTYYPSADRIKRGFRYAMTFDTQFSFKNWACEAT